MELRETLLLLLEKMHSCCFVGVKVVLISKHQPNVHIIFVLSNQKNITNSLPAVLWSPRLRDDSTCFELINSCFIQFVGHI